MPASPFVPPSLELLSSNDEITIHYAHTSDIWNRQEILLDEQFAFMTVTQVLDTTPDPILVLEDTIDQIGLNGKLPLISNLIPLYSGRHLDQ